MFKQSMSKTPFLIRGGLKKLLSLSKDSSLQLSSSSLGFAKNSHKRIFKETYHTGAARRRTDPVPAADPDPPSQDPDPGRIPGRRGRRRRRIAAGAKGRIRKNMRGMKKTEGIR